jgi:hypothetical protein
MSNLNVMIVIASTSIVKCQVLGLNENFQGICFGHVFSKACQYPTINERFAKSLDLFLSSLINQICKNV